MELDSTHNSDIEWKYTMLDGIEIKIGKNVVDFWEKIIELPPKYKVQLLGLTEENVEDYLNAKRTGLQLSILEFLKKKWKYRATGDNVILDDLIEFEFPYLGNLKQLKKDIKSKKLSISMMRELNDFFISQEKVYQ